MAGGDASFEKLASGILDDILARRPEVASDLGDHRFDDRLTAYTAEALEDDRKSWRGHLAALDAVDVESLSQAEAVDAAILRNELNGLLLELEEIRQHEWNPLVSNPGDAIYLLLARDYAPIGKRLESLGKRVAAIPEYLDTARRNLGRMPRVHVETALVQFAGTLTLLTTEIDRTLEEATSRPDSLGEARSAAIVAVEEHRQWLESQLANADGDPRIGPEMFARKLPLTLDTDITLEEIRARAEADLDRLDEELVRTASELGVRGSVKDAFDLLAADRPSDDTIVGLATASLAETTSFVEDHGLVSVFDDPLDIIVMPEFRRGGSVAYCDPPGPLEADPLPTFYAVSPTPADWDQETVESFYREYNSSMVHELTIHEAMPGHFVQLSHSTRATTSNRLRAALLSGPFVEGWAVYTEHLMAAHGYGGPAVKMQRLKMALRATINALLDQGVHCRTMTETEAMTLMTGRGYQEYGEAVGKWRRAQLTSTQLSTYYVGYSEVSDAVAALRAARPGASERDLHDEFLSHGSPPTRHLRTLLGLSRS